MNTVAIAGLLVGADVDLQGPQRLDQFLVQLPERLGDLTRLGHPLATATLLAGSGRDLGFGDPPGVDGLQRPRLQRAAVLADAAGPKLAPQLHELGSVGSYRGWCPTVVGGDIRGLLGCREVVVQKKLLDRPAAVRSAALLVGCDLLAAELLEGALAVGEELLPFLLYCSGLRARRGTARLVGWPAPLFQRRCVEGLAPLVRDPHHGHVVDVRVLFVHCPKSFQGPRDVATPTDGEASLSHPGIIAEGAPVVFSAVAPRRPPRMRCREEARQVGREAAADSWHDAGGARRRDTILQT